MKDWLELHLIKVQKAEAQASIDLKDYKAFIRKQAKIINYKPEWSQTTSQAEKEKEIQDHNIQFLNKKFTNITQEVAQMIVVGMNFKLKENDDNICQEIGSKTLKIFGFGKKNKEGKQSVKQETKNNSFRQIYVIITNNLKMGNKLFQDESQTPKNPQKIQTISKDKKENFDFIISTRGDEDNARIKWDKNNDRDLLDKLIVKNRSTV